MTERPRIREAGDGALLLQLRAAIDPHVNAQAIAIAGALRVRALPGIRDVVSTFRSVAVYFDPLAGDPRQIAAALQEAATAAPASAPGRRHEIPVHYGDDDGPDLAEVAARAHLSEAQAVQRHAAVPYRVFMLGFQPGFAYLGLVDPAIATPRRATPRLRVPAGSVGIAGRQTGIYPASSPGGWQIVGRALEPVFDAARTAPARFAPGDTVTFVSTRDAVTPSRVNPPSPTPRASRYVTVLRPGLFTTIQDAGRWGQQGIGMPVSGAMDRISHAAANAAVGNDSRAALLEVTIAGPELRIDSDLTLAIAGADLSATLDGGTVPLQAPVRARAGSVLRFGGRVNGSRTYVAFDGGVRLDRRWPVSPLTAGEAVSLDGAPAAQGRTVRPMTAMPAGGARLRVIPGPQDDELPGGCVEALVDRRFTISPQSNRMGYRLAGPAVPSAGGEMISDCTFPGAIQVPPSGEPILLLADRQTTGGYPQAATVISADLPVAAQLAPGDWIEFVVCSRAEAVAALVAQEAMLRDVR